MKHHVIQPRLPWFVLVLALAGWSSPGLLGAPPAQRGGVSEAALAEEREAAAAEAVDLGRDAFSGRWPQPSYNWYDSEQDDVRPIDARTPFDWSWDGPSNLPSGNILKYLAWGALAVLLGILAYLLIKAYLNREEAGLDSSAHAREEQPLTTAQIEALPFPARRQADDLLGTAQRLYLNGDYTQAIIYLFSHELVVLDRGQRIALARGKTNRVYLRELSNQPTLKQILARTTTAFESVFFGNHTLDRHSFERCWSELGELTKLAGNPT